jgi:hypothetical protein
MYPPMVDILKVTNLKSKTEYKAPKQIGEEGELVTTLTIEAVISPGDIGTIAALQNKPEALMVNILSRQAGFNVDQKTGEIKDLGDVLHQVADQVNAGAMDKDGVKVRASVTRH